MLETVSNTVASFLNKSVIIAMFFTGVVEAADQVGEDPQDMENPPEQKRRDLFFDREDNMLDLSPWLATASGFLPTGSIITEPAVGYGGVLGYPPGSLSRCAS